MTTLPQTTPIRVPQHSGPSHLAVPVSAQPTGGSTSSPPMTGADVWRVIRANIWLIVILVAVSSIAGYFFNGYLENNFSVYTATGWVRILPAPSVDPLHTNNVGINYQELSIEQKSDAQLLRTDGLINKVLGDSTNPIRQTNWYNNTCNGEPEKARKLLDEKLVVIPIPDSQLIRVDMSAPDRKDTPVIITAIVNQAIADNRDFISRKNSTEQKRYLDLKEQYRAELADVTKEVDELASELNLSGSGTIAGGSSPKEIELSKDVEAQMKASSDFNDADEMYNNLMGELQQGQDPPQIEQMVNRDALVMSYRDQLEDSENTLSLASDRYGPQNPTVLRMQKVRDFYQQKLDDTKAEVASQLRESMKSETKTARDDAKKQLDDVNDKVSKLKSEMAELGNKMALYQSRREQQEEDRKAVDEYDKALADMDQMVRAADFSSLDWAQPPQEPDRPTFPQLPVTMGFAIGIGLALSLGIAFLREVTDTSVRSPRDIQRVGQISLLGMVPHEADDPQAAGARLPLVIFEAPHSIMAEQLRQVRTRLQHAASLDTTRSILVTSPSPGDGKSTIAVNLAAGLALNGRRILLVDANFRRPELHRIFGIANDTGFADALNDINTFETGVRETPVPNLSVMASGPRPSNPTELLESQLLLDFIERALEEYDHVIFDSGPMLFVSDSVALAPRVDGVVTVVRARASTRGVLQRMRDTLRAVKAEHLGIVLNGVRSQAGGYYGSSIKTYYAYQNAG